MKHPASCLVVLLLAPACATVRRAPASALLPESAVAPAPDDAAAAPDDATLVAQATGTPASGAPQTPPTTGAPQAQPVSGAPQTQPPSELAAPQQVPAAAPPSKANKPPRIFGEMTLAGGVYEHDTRSDASQFTGHADGGLARMRGEYIFDQGIGAGMALEGSASDDKLFGDTGNRDVRGRTSDAFLFFVALPTEPTESFRLPVRVGPYFHSVVLDDDVTSLQTRWNSVGLRVEIEPEVWFLRRDRFALGMFAVASAGAHATNVVLKGGGGRTYFDGSTGGTLGGEVGFQALWGQHVTTRLGYIYRATREGEPDSHNGLDIHGVNQTFNGVMLAAGVRF